MISNPAAALELARLLAAGGGTLASLADRLALVYEDRPMVASPEPIPLTGGASSLTFREAAALVARIGAILKPRVRPGHPLVIHGPNGFGFFLACLGAARAGATFVPLNPQMRDEEIAHVLADASGDLIELSWLEAKLAEGRGYTRPNPAAAPARDDVAAILYTSGTTGRPKGAMLTHQGLLEQPSRMLLVPLKAGDEMVVGLPVAHVMGFEVLLSAAFAGIPLYLLPKFRPLDVLDAIGQRRSTVFAGVPAMYRMMLDAGAETRDLRSIKLWISAADVMPEDLALRFKALGSLGLNPLTGKPFGEAAFAELYGMVELAGAVAGRISLPHLGKGGQSLGFPLPPYKLRVVDEHGSDLPPGTVGELVVEGPGVLRGYHGDEAASRAIRHEGGGIRTGDLARRDWLGMLHFVGRSKDVIKYGGYSVFPAEIEEAFRQHPAVADIAVIGRADPIKGEVPVAFVELAPDAQIDPDTLRRWAGQHLAEYKVPVDLRIVSALPRNASGKVVRPQLRAEL